jgi:hypothetical protein
MTSAAIKSAPILRTASGEPQLGPDGKSFREDQGEIICHDNPRYATAARIAVLRLASTRAAKMRSRMRAKT